jgi:prepilin-type N-terminal cleavage/methylation domain-containing protein
MKLANGFSLIELLTVLVIIGILVSVAIPSYQSYIKRAHYSEVVTATSPYKAGVEACFQMMGALTHCNGGQYSVPPNTSNQQDNGLVDRVTVKRGEITVIPKSKYGIDQQDRFILTPRAHNHQLSWYKHGQGVEQGYAR